MNTATKSRKAVKLVTIIYAYVFKHLNRVCFVVLSDEGQKKVDSDPNYSPKQEDTYNTCFDNGKGSCTCRGNAEFHLECYHIKQLAPVAVARLAKAQAKATSEKVVRNRATAEAMLEPRTSHEEWIEYEIAATTAAARSANRHSAEKLTERYEDADYAAWLKATGRERNMNREEYDREFDPNGLNLL